MTAGRQAVSTTKDWCTPPHLIQSVKEVFGGTIELDPCSNSYSLVEAQRSYQLPTSDGLKEPWDARTIFVNPPYGSDPIRRTRILHWFRKIDEAHNKGSEIIALVPVATNTTHWKEFVYPLASAICFLSAPRLRFYVNGIEDPKGAPMACAVIYYGKNFKKFSEIFKEHGAVIPLQNIYLPPKSNQLEF